MCYVDDKCFTCMSNLNPSHLNPHNNSVAKRIKNAQNMDTELAKGV